MYRYGIVLLLLLPLAGLPQGEAQKWFFGLNAGLDFNGGSPLSITGGQVFTSEGSASIADANGNLLFYTDGMNVWDKNHTSMPNGTGLMGHSSSTQSGVIIKKPGSSNIYYIFTADIQTGTGGLRYSEVDMTLNGGLGDVTVNKNVLLQSASCEKITGVRHCNNNDVWVVTHDWGSDAFRTFLVTPAGVNPVPVISNVGLFVPGTSGSVIGQLKSSPDGRRLASAIWEISINRFELFDFDNSTGTVSHQILLPQIPASSGAYGVEFSPDGTKLYASIITPGEIYQFDLCAGTDSAVAASGIKIGQSANNFNGSLQLGPDNKIYSARCNVSWVGVINNPNLAGLACNYVDNGVSIGNALGGLGLPNFVPYYVTASHVFSATTSCDTAWFIAPPVLGAGCNPSQPSVLWNFGDPVSGTNNTSSQLSPTHIYSGAGTHTVTLIINYACGADTIAQVITTQYCGLAANVSATNALCNGQCTGSASVTAVNGTAPYSYLWSTGDTTQTVSGLCTGSYTVATTDAGATTVTDVIIISEPPALTATATSGIDCGGQCNGSAAVLASGGTPGYVYAWNTTPSQSTASVSGLCQGNYTCTVTDTNGCTVQQAITIQPSSPLLVNLVSQMNASCNASCNGTAMISVTGGIPAYSYSWSTNPVQTGPLASNLCAGTYTCAISDSVGCIESISVTISQPQPLTASITFTPGCNGGNNGTASVSVNGGTSPYTIAWSTWPVQYGSNAVSLAPGTYTALVTDSNNCLQTAEVVTYEEVPVDSLLISTVYCEGAATTILSAPPGGVAGNTIGPPYEWAYQGTAVPNSNMDSYTVSLTNISGHAVSWYYGGCRYVSTQIDSTVLSDVALLQPVNIFSPNDDDLNDYFFPLTLPNGRSPSDLEGAIDDYSLLVYDRWGRLVFESTSLQVSWKGTDKSGKDMSAGTYYWLLSYTSKCESLKELQVHKGFVQLIR